MAIQKFNEYIKQQDESKKTIGIQKFSDYAKDNNLSYKINKFKPNAGKDTNKWFKKGAFEDGYQKGDAILTTLGTVADFGTNVLRGAGSLVEGVTDLGTYALAGVSSVLGEKEIASKLKETASKSWVDNAVSSLELDGELDNYSILGDKSDSISQGIGQIGTMMLTGGIGASAGLGTAGTTALTTSLIGTSGMGSGMNEAYQNGATDGEAVVYGLINGAADAGTELIFGGLGKAVNAVGLSKGLTSADDMLAKTISNKFKSQLAKNLTEYTVKSLAEGSEELMSGVIQSIGKKLTYMSEKELSTIIKDEKLLDQFITGSITSAIAQAPSLVRITSQGGEYIENTDTKKKGEISNEKDINKNEISTSDKQIIINQISEISNQLEEYRTLQKQNKLTKEQQQQMVKLEEQLNALQKEVDNQNNAVFEEKTNMPTVNDIVAQEQKISNVNLPSSKINSNKVNLPTVNDLAKNSINTNNNINQSLPIRNLTFEESASKYNIDINNDTIRSISKLMSNRGITARFDSQLFNDNNTNAIWVPITNKSKQIVGREVVFNPNADTNQLLQDVAVHEIYHDIASNDNGNVLNELIQSFNMNIEGFDKARQELAEMYAKKYPNLDQNSTEFQQLIDEEVAASILGKKLGSQEYINRLVHEKPSIAKRIYDFVVDKLNQLNRLVGYKSEKIFWEDVKNKFEKAYREEYNSRIENNTIEKYSTIGIKGAKNLEKNSNERRYNQLYNYLKTAKEIAEENKGKSLETRNIETKKQTQWYQTKYGDWGTLISDKNSKLIQKLKPNKTYRLGEILEHDLLYKAYPELKKLKVKTANIETTGGYASVQQLPANTITDEIYIRNSDLSEKDFRKTLLHEVNHYIEHKENYDKRSKGANSKTDGKENYKNNLGEIISNETKINSDLTQQELDDIILPEQAKLNPKYENIKQRLLESNREDLLKSGDDRNALQNLELSVQDKIKNIEKDNKQNNSIRRIKNDIDEVSNSENNHENNQIFQEGIRNNSLYRLNKGDSNESYEENSSKNKENDLQIDDSMGRVPRGRGLEKYDKENNSISSQNLSENIYSRGMLGRDSKGQGLDNSSFSNDTWQEYLDKNYKSEGTGQTLQDIKLPTRKDVTKINVPSIESKVQTKQIVEEPQKLANILKERPVTMEEKDNWLVKLLKIKLLDKGHYVNELSRKTKNRELASKYDYMLGANGIAQQIIGNERFNPKTQKSEGKGLHKIFEPIENSGKLQEFTEYMYHKHNVSRMSLNTLFQEDNKPIFGDGVTSETSKKIVEDFENKNPEFIEWAEEVYNYNNFLLDVLVDYGVIGKEDKSYYNNKYPYYVPTIRATDKIKTQMEFIGKKASVNTPIKKAKGGNQDIIPLKEAMALRTMQTMNSALRNNFGIELLNTIETEAESNKVNIDDVVGDDIDAEEFLTKSTKKAPATLTVFQNGEKITFDIADEIYEALAPSQRYKIKALNNISNLRRALITEYNPAFMLTNPIKDVQDGALNSKHSSLFLKNIAEATKQISSKGDFYKLYLANGGSYETYFNYGEGYNKLPTKRGNLDPRKILDKISQINQSIEMTPRLAEFISSLEAGESIETAMYNAQEITTNFKRGGDWTKNLDANGVTFLNAGVQGALKQVRNFQEAKSQGIKGITNLAVKWSIAGITPYILSQLIWGDDDDYEELSDYVKNNYYILWKNSDGTFVRIPKGRVMSVIQNLFKQPLDALKGEKIDVKEFVELLQNQVLPSDPTESNIISPLLDVAQNKTWYGGDLVPQRLQSLPEEEQYDESTDSISIWLGQTLGISPIKINYILDQYSGAIGDMILPTLTLEAENDSNSFMSNLLAPMKDKFTTDSVMNNQNISDLYDLDDELTKKSKSSNASTEDILKSKYINSIQTEMNKLTAEKRTIQNDTTLTNNEKYKQVKEIQKQINQLAKDGLNNYNNVEVYDNYAKVGDKEYYKNNSDEWQKLDTSTAKYKTVNQITTYDKYLTYQKEIDIIKDKYENTNQRKNAVINYVNSLKLSIPQKAMLIKMNYSSFNSYNSQIIEYINKQDLSKSEKEKILTKLGFTIKDGRVYY